MSTYTVEQLRKDGPQYAMALLLECLKEGEPSVTYGEIREELEHQLEIERIFSVQIGEVAGSLMDQILKIDKNAPLINSLITRPNGLPGEGVGNYFANKYGKERYRKWKGLPVNKKKMLVNEQRSLVYKYDRWNEISDELFGKHVFPELIKKNNTEKDGVSLNGKNYGGPAESDEHKALKTWVSENPGKIGLRKSFGKGKTEAGLLSGDSIDVLFSDGNEFVTVEVKSCRSNDADFRRGIYQCVKYKTVKEAEHLPHQVLVRTMLVIERKLTDSLEIRARLLGVKVKCVSVNTIPND